MVVGKDNRGCSRGKNGKGRVNCGTRRILPVVARLWGAIAWTEIGGRKQRPAMCSPARFLVLRNAPFLGVLYTAFVFCGSNGYRIGE